MMTTAYRAGYNFAGTQTLYTLDCSECHILYAIPDDLDDRARKDKSIRWYCPNGHTQVYKGTENDRLKRELAQAEARLTATQDQRRAAEAEVEEAGC
jgi:hypothetical protein